MPAQQSNFIFLFIIAFANLATALITMLIMAHKGRSGLPGFALSLVGIIIAMIITEDRCICTGAAFCARCGTRVR